MRILAIDPGYERLGIAVLEKKDRKEILLYSSCFKTSAKKEFMERLSEVGEEIKKVIKEYKPEALAIENLIFNTNQRTAMRVAEVRGAITYIALENGLIVHEYNPLQIKVAITSYGHATKEQMTTMVEKILTLPPKKRLDDEYDAIAVGLTHFAVSRPHKS